MNEIEAAPATADSLFFSAPDGLRLHVRRHGRPQARGLPVVCLPGLSRTTADFDDLGASLARDYGRLVLALDYRGRGLSDYDRNPNNYNLGVELADAIAAMTALSATPAVIVGTSRGGLLAMLLGAARPGMIAGVILNDIGPAIEAKGLMRIKASLGKTPEPKDFADGAEILRRLHGTQFPKLTPAQWFAFAHRTWREKDGRLIPTYDRKLSVALEAFDLEQPLPTMWKEFDALAKVPMMVVRGVNSDILTAETLAGMQARRTETSVIEVPDQGHTPLLCEPDVITRIADFIRRCDS